MLLRYSSFESLRDFRAGALRKKVAAQELLRHQEQKWLFGYISLESSSDFRAGVIRKKVTSQELLETLRKSYRDRNRFSSALETSTTKIALPGDFSRKLSGASWEVGLRREIASRELLRMQ